MGLVEALDFLDARLAQVATDAVIQTAAIFDAEGLLRAVAEHTATEEITLEEEFGKELAAEVAALKERNRKWLEERLRGDK